MFPPCLLRPRLLPRHVAFFSTIGGERMRIAICGGGAAGLSTALHLAELVDRGLVAGPIDVFDANLSSTPRAVGVGLWSTAILPFQNSWRASHQLVWEDLMHHGKWVKDVGYRTPYGTWLAVSQLPTEVSAMKDSMPALLFLREQDMLHSLRKAVHLEEMKGTIQIHQGKQSTVTGIDEYFVPPFSAKLKLRNGTCTERDYHLIVAADGMNSVLRQRYGGHRILRRLIGTTALGSPFDAKQERYEGPANEASWEEQEQTEANAIEDRGYTVFRGNADISSQDAGMDGISFQTWGEGNSMRFATVPLSYPGGPSGRGEQQVWFITTSEKNVTNETDPMVRKEKLLKAFDKWHDPIQTLIEATPATEILVERAMAHRHSVGPVLNLNRVLRQVYKTSPPSSGPGPAVVFIGDSFMTVDPILAQGFTMAMEGSAALAPSVEASILQFQDTGLAFDPYELRNQLQQRHDERNGRLLHLLQATEIVQALGQPQGGLVGSLSRYVVRPLMQLAPDFIKRPIFNAMLTYSLKK